MATCDSWNSKQLCVSLYIDCMRHYTLYKFHSYNGILFSSAEEGAADSWSDMGNKGQVQNTVLRYEVNYESV